MAVTYYGTGHYYIDNGQFWPTTTTTITPVVTPQTGESVNTRIKAVRVKAGFLGQVTVIDGLTGNEVILWESEPKKTLAKADKAAKKAQLRAAQRSFE